MPRFYVPFTPEPQQICALPDATVRHIHVLRLRVGDPITLFNGDGRAYHAELSLLEKRRAECRITAVSAAECESPLAVTLVQAVSGGERMDFTLQKSVELGVAAIQPVISSRSVVRLSGERADKRQARWQEIVIAACEQCGRNRVPPVLPLLGFQEYLTTKPPQTHLIMSLNHARSLKSLPPPDKLSLLVGPEGGWTAEEEAAALAAGCQAFVLGQRVLRTETASLAALAAMQTLWGDFV